MNKLYKFILGVFIIGIGIVNTTNAKNSYGFSPTPVNIATNSISTAFNLNGFYCLKAGTQICNQKLNFYDLSGNLLNIDTNDTIGAQTVFCFDIPVNVENTYVNNCQVYKYTTFNDIKSIFTGTFNCPTCPTCEEQYTSLECQTEYNLIPIENVTANYCKLNFDLIEPTECPDIGEGTGAINWTARYINNQQYPGTASLKLNIADFLERQTTYNQDETIVEVIGYDADEDYINDIIDKEQLTPTKDDFAYLISNLGDYIPLFAVAGLMLRAWRIIKKVF